MPKTLSLVVGRIPGEILRGAPACPKRAVTSPLVKMRMRNSRAISRTVSSTSPLPGLRLSQWRPSLTGTAKHVFRQLYHHHPNLVDIAVNRLMPRSRAGLARASSVAARRASACESISLRRMTVWNARYRRSQSTVRLRKVESHIRLLSFPDRNVICASSSRTSASPQKTQPGRGTARVFLTPVRLQSVTKAKARFAIQYRKLFSHDGNHNKNKIVLLHLFDH